MRRRMTEEEWAALDALTDEEVHARALSAPDCPPDDGKGHWFRARPEDGDTWPERLRNALKRARAAGRIPPGREAGPEALAAGMLDPRGESA